VSKPTLWLIHLKCGCYFEVTSRRATVALCQRHFEVGKSKPFGALLKDILGEVPDWSSKSDGKQLTLKSLTGESGHA
jgi:hypothetical protein